MRKIILLILITMLLTQLYGENRNLKKMCFYTSEDSINNIVEYEYNEDNQIEYEYRYISDDKVTGFKHYTYSNSNLVRIENYKVVKAGDSCGGGIYENDDEIFLGYTIYEYENNKLYKELKYFKDDVLGEEIIYEYNSMGLLITEKHINRAPSERAQVRNYLKKYNYDDGFLYRVDTYEGDIRRSYSYRIYKDMGEDEYILDSIIVFKEDKWNSIVDEDFILFYKKLYQYDNSGNIIKEVSYRIEAYIESLSNYITYEYE